MLSFVDQTHLILLSQDQEDWTEKLSSACLIWRYVCFVLFCLLLLVLFFFMCVVWSKRTMNEQTRLQSGERPLFATLQQHICQARPAVMIMMMRIIRTFFHSRKLMRADWVPSYYNS